MTKSKRDYSEKIAYWNGRLADAQTISETMKCHDKLEYFEGRQKEISQGSIVTELIKRLEGDLSKAKVRKEAFEGDKRRGHQNVDTHIAWCKAQINQISITLFDIKELTNNLG